MHDAQHNPAAGAVRAEAPALPCVGCGYDLRASPAHGQCPECGVEVWKSLHGGRLDHVDPKWLARVVRGQAILAPAWMALTCVIALGVAAAWLAVILMAANVPPMIAFDVMLVGGALTFNAALVCLAVGAAMVARPEPREATMQRTDLRRFVARWGFAVCAAAFILVETRQTAWVLGVEGEWVLTAALAPAWFASAACLLSYLSTLARRLSRENVGEQMSELLKSHATLSAVLAWFGLAVVAVLAFSAFSTAFGFVVLGVGALFSIPVSLIVAIAQFGAALAMRDVRNELRHSLAQARARLQSA